MRFEISTLKLQRQVPLSLSSGRHNFLTQCIISLAGDGGMALCACAVSNIWDNSLLYDPV